MFSRAVTVGPWPLAAIGGLAVLAILLVEASIEARRRGRRGLARLAITEAWFTLPLSLVACGWLCRSCQQPVIAPIFGIWEGLLVELLAPAAASCLAVLAVWAGLGRAHWFLRMLAVVGAIALPAIIPAHELVVMGFVQSAVTIVPLLAMRFFFGTERSVGPKAEPNAAFPDKAGRRRAQFALMDLILGTVLAALVMGLAVAVPKGLWIAPERNAALVAAGVVPDPPPGVFFAAWGAVFGIGVLVAAWVALRREARWSRLPAVLPAVPMAPAIVWLALWRASSGRRKRSARVALALLSTVLLVPLAIVYYRLVTWPPVPQPVLPEPNGYVRAVEAARELAGVNVPESSDSRTARATFCAAHGGTIQRGRRALDCPTRVPLQFTEADIPSKDFFDLRQLARALAAAADLAIEEDRLSDAVAYRGDAIRLGKVSAHGGLVIHWLVGVALEGIGLAGVHRLAGTLTPEQCRTAMDVVAARQADRESVDEVWARDKEWSGHAYGWRGRLSLILAFSDRAPTYHALKQAEQRAEARAAVVLTELAVRAYQVEQGRLPHKLADLVPAYLPAVPGDLATGEPLEYRREGAGYRVSSPSFSDEELWGPPPAASAVDDWGGEPPKEKEPG